MFPTFAQQYTDETVYNNSLVVESGERYRYISYDDIYITDADLYSYSYTTSFDGEGELPATFSEQVEKENIELNPFSLLNVDEIPEDADAVLIYAPSSDISEEEANMLTIHLDNENFECVQIDLYRYDGESCLAVVDLMEAVDAIVL